MTKPRKMTCVMGDLLANTPRKHRQNRKDITDLLTEMGKSSNFVAQVSVRFHRAPVTSWQQWIKILPQKQSFFIKKKRKKNFRRNRVALWQRVPLPSWSSQPNKLANWGGPFGRVFQRSGRPCCAADMWPRERSFLPAMRALRQRALTDRSIGL